MFASTLLAATLVAPGAVPTVPAPDVKDNVQKGLKWLTEQQAKDGSWVGRNDSFKTQSTAFAGLALLMQGSTLKDGPYAENIRRTVEWFETIAQPNGMIGQPLDRVEANRYVHSHAIALLFLASVHDLDENRARRDRVAKIINRGVAFAVEMRTKRGGWGYIDPRQLGGDNGDAFVTATVLHALLIVERAGFTVPQDAIQGATQFLLDATGSDGGVSYSVAPPSQRTPGQAIMSAGASLALGGASRRPEKLGGWIAHARRTMTHVPVMVQPNFNATNGYSMQDYFASARLAHMVGDDGHQALDPKAAENTLLRWSPHRERLFKFLKATQKADGLWEDQTFGDAYSSALALIMLQLDNNYLPAFSR